jgi:hypothetical protein
MSNTEYKGFSLDIDDDVQGQPSEAEYNVYSPQNDHIGTILRTFKTNSATTWGVERRQGTSRWYFEWFTGDGLETEDKQEFDASKFKTYRSAFKHMVDVHMVVGEEYSDYGTAVKIVQDAGLIKDEDGFLDIDYIAIAKLLKEVSQ